MFGSVFESLLYWRGSPGSAQSYVEHESVFADVTAVRTDQDGNIYAAYYHSDAFSRVDIYSTDGRRHALTPGGSELSAAIVLMKYDKYGRLIWNTTVPDWYATNNIDIELDNQGDILLMGAIGILNNNTIMVVFAPELYSIRRFSCKCLRLIIQLLTAGLKCIVKCCILSILPKV